MVDKKKMTGILIHGFAAAHAATALILAQTVIGDEAALTALTVTMIMAVAKINGADWDSGTALAFLGVFIGSYAGMRGAAFLVKWIPGLGNCINAIVTAATTEVLGWATYVFVQKCKKSPELVFDPSKITREEMNEIWEEARNLRKEERQASKQLYNSIPKKDKDRYDSIMERLRSNKISETERKELIEELEPLLTGMNEKDK